MSEHRVQLVLQPDRAPLAVVAETLDLVNDMLELADEFSLELPFTPENWERTAPDSEVRVVIDDSTVLTGFIDERVRTGDRASGSSIRVRGRDKGGRIVDESAPLVVYQGLSIAELARQIVSPWFSVVTLSNARNRQLIKGRKHRSAKVAREPVILAGKDLRRKVEPGESRGEILTFFLEKADLLGWSTADGREFVIGRPNYSQAPQWRFFFAGPDSSRAGDINVEGFEYTESITDRYAQIVACGSSSGTSASYGSNVTKRQAAAKNNPVSTDGTGLDFQRPKTLRISDDDIKSAAQAKTRAEREMKLRDAQGKALHLIVGGFGQAIPDATQFFSPPAIFAVDTVARWEDEEADISEDYLITRVHFTQDRDGGQVTELDLVPTGTELRAR